MFATYEGQRLYLTSWVYNGLRVMSRVAKLVEMKGGKVKYNESMYIVNRSIYEKIREKETDIERFKNVSAKLGKAIDTANIEAEIAELKAIPNAPIKVTHGSYIRFILNDMCYYYEFDENPFFDFHYIKTPIVDGKYSRDAYLEESSKSWTLNGLFKIGCSSETIDKAAELLLDELLNAKPSGIHREGKKRRVQNYGGCGYHYEVIYAAERWETVDF